MTHSDVDVLAMMALGESGVSAADVTHIADCGVCRTELDRLSRVTQVARENGPVELQLREVPARVWERIQHDIDTPPASIDPQSSVASQVRNWQPRRRWRLAAVAVVIVLVAVLVGVAVVSRPSGTVEASAALRPLPAWSTSHGTATMQRTPNGTTLLDIKLSSPAVNEDGSSFREVWLMDITLTKAISVGLLDDGSGEFVMPSSVAAADYPVVDISEQPLNGDPAHSGNSIVRGTLAPASP